MKDIILTEKVRCCGCTSDTCKSSAPSHTTTEKSHNSDENPAQTVEDSPTQSSSCGSSHKILEKSNKEEAKT